MDFRKKYGSTALIAGGSEGLGAAFAHALAARGLGLVLIGRRKEKLDAIVLEIQEKYGIQPKIIVCDLAAGDAMEQIKASIGDLPIDFLVYNAGLSYIGPYLDTGIQTHTDIAMVNMVTQHKMIHYFGGKMVERGWGGIVLMSSLAGRQGSGFLSAYAASKAFNLVLAESLWYEWKNKGVDVIGCCAGATTTENYINSKPKKASVFAPKPQSPAEVVEECLKRIGKRPSFVSGRGNKFASFIMQRLFTRKMAINTMGDTTRKMYGITD